jgi:ABC-type multidrug transport system ATPase subunit
VEYSTLGTGDAGYSIRLCQQHDFLFSELTVREHLYLASEIRGIDKPTTFIELIEELLDIQKF